VVVYDYHCMILCGLRYGSASKSGRIGIRVARRRVYARADKLWAGHVESHAVGMDEGWRDRGACTYIGRVFADGNRGEDLVEGVFLLEVLADRRRYSRWVGWWLEVVVVIGFDVVKRKQSLAVSGGSDRRTVVRVRRGLLGVEWMMDGGEAGGWQKDQQ
jgi:hypothetical protein